MGKMKADQERVKNLLIDTVTLLCKNSLTYEDELCVEGLLGVKVDQKDVFFVHISETFPSALSLKKAQEAQEAQRLEEEERLREERLREEEAPGTPSSGQSSGHKRTHSPAQRDSPHHKDGQQKVNIKTESVDSGDDCLITDEPPQTPLRNPSSIGAHPAQRIAGQRRPAPSPRSPGNHRDSYSDQHHTTFQSNSSYSEDYPEFSNVGKHEGDHGGVDGEPPRKRAAMSEGDNVGDDGEDSYGGSQWPNLAGVQGIGDFAGQVAQQAFQDSGDSQMSGGGGDMSQPGCSSWPTGLQQQATDTVPPTQKSPRKKINLPNPNIKCNQCPKSMFRSRIELQRHMRTHTGEQPYGCPNCGKTFAQSSTLYRHRKAIHPETQPPDPSLVCELCGQADFRIRTELVRHMRAHRGKQVYTCKVCGKSFAQSGNLSRHMKTQHAPGGIPGLDQSSLLAHSQSPLLAQSPYALLAQSVAQSIAQRYPLPPPNQRPPPVQNQRPQQGQNQRPQQGQNQRPQQGQGQGPALTAEQQLLQALNLQPLHQQQKQHPVHPPKQQILLVPKANPSPAQFSDQRSFQGQNQRPLQGQNPGHFQGQNQGPLQGQNQGPFQGQDQQPLPVDDEQLLQARVQQLLQAQATSHNSEQNPLPEDDEQLLQARVQQLMRAQESGVSQDDEVSPRQESDHNPLKDEHDEEDDDLVPEQFRHLLQTQDGAMPSRQATDQNPLQDEEEQFLQARVQQLMQAQVRDVSQDNESSQKQASHQNPLQEEDDNLVPEQFRHLLKGQEGGASPSQASDQHHFQTQEEHLLPPQES